MTKYLSSRYESIVPGCGCPPFFVLASTKEAWQKDGTWWWCPYCGNKRHFVGETEEQRLERELEASENKAAGLQSDLDDERRKYNRIRDRVKNGVCPCCDRHFSNLLKHMQTKHPDFGDDQALRAIRLHYGMTQIQLAEEIGMNVFYISRAENAKHIPDWAQIAIEDWMSAQAS